jgi:hypothetical protein
MFITTCKTNCIERFSEQSQVARINKPCVSCAYSFKRRKVERKPVVNANGGLDKILLKNYPVDKAEKFLKDHYHGTYENRVDFACFGKFLWNCFTQKIDLLF